MSRKLKYYKGWMVITIAMCFVSCTEIIDIELDSTYQRLVVFGTVTTDSVRHQVQLSTSSDYFSNMPSPRVSGALVELEYGNNLLQMEEHDTIPGLYLTPFAFRGFPDTRYQLHISQVDINEDGIPEVYHAESTMPEGIQLDSIRPIYFQSPFVSGYQIFMYGLDPPTREWYGFKMWRNSDMLTDTLMKYSVQSDDFYNGSYIYGIPVGFLSDDEPREAIQPGDTITFELNSIEQDYYNFIVDAQLEIVGNNPLFSGPSANIVSNIDNEAKGIFTAYSIQRVSLVIPD
ncbi:MAG: DUF4249 domain-containing protein [Bacteroidales bacterium]|nr:DUF4249 domain-containing protein [Bacteroidales bacterium]